MVATSPLAAVTPLAASHCAMSFATPCRRSSKIFGKAKVVDWNTRLETAVVRNTIAVMRSISAFMSGPGRVDATEGGGAF